MRKWKIFSGILSVLLAIAVAVFGCRDSFILISQAFALAGGVLSLISAHMKGISLRRMNACLIAAFGLSVSVGLYNHAGLWMFAVAAVWSVICCLAACVSIAIKQ